MSKIDGYKFISVDPETCHGSARIDGTRIAIWMLAQDLSNGSDLASLKSVYGLADEQLAEALRFIQQNHLEGYLNVAHR